MTESIIVAIIAGLVTSLGTLLGYISSEKARKDKIAAEHLKEFEDVKSSINSKLEEHKTDYMSKIQNVEAAINEMQNVYQKTVAVVDLKIEALEKKQDVHNNLISRMYEVEKRTDVQDEMIRVANHRISDLEKRND